MIPMPPSDDSDIADAEVEIKQDGEGVDTVAKTYLTGGLKAFRLFGNVIQTVLTVVVIVGVIIGLYGALTSNILLVFFGGITAVGAMTLKNPWFGFL